MPGQICLRLLYERAHTPKAYAYKQDFLAYIFVKVVFSVWLQAQHRKFDIYANETQNNGNYQNFSENYKPISQRVEHTEKITFWLYLSLNMVHKYKLVIAYFAR